MKNYNLEFTRGDTFGFRFLYEDTDGEAITFDEAYFSCREYVDSEEYLFQKSLEDGITLLDDGSYRVEVTPADTNDLNYGNYWYDLEVTKDDQVITPMKGKLVLGYDITRNSNSSI